MALKVENINSENDMLNYLEGCLNDLENGISTKSETMQNLVDYTSKVVQLARGNNDNKSTDKALILSGVVNCPECGQPGFDKLKYTCMNSECSAFFL